MKNLFYVFAMTMSVSCGSGHQFREPSVPVETAPMARPSGDDATVDTGSPVSDENGTVSNLPTPSPVVPVVKDPEPVACSTLYSIPGIANPFLAGMPSGTEIAYPASVDRAPANSPILVTPTDRQCFEAGRYLYFRVEGKIAHGTMTDQESDADGIPTAPGTHTLAGMNNLSNIKAPINSLIGIFLDDRTPEQRPASPATLDFNEGVGRNFKTLAPELGQIFFIGDGKDASGKLQGFTVPTGTTRLYLAIMDAYEWNNNLGKLSGGILWVKP
ncbi:MAG: hypothetical protein M3Q07_23175 [Pseudobdellovibrionaceae bacterium]|uniref:hypothetical protein n=1 Tax=Oligoflexus sp. TaxID=1971216 RepID=UPI0027CB945E|nr:hypothetical protein [Oligoflexus sp.]MDQ3234718.1 hypothetical protein [Pseudobdellovibrionaceae bacterium]HYX31945.1 hypothetical protein [Oligoflexus sp.]